MGQRNPSAGASVQLALRGKTLWQITDEGTVMKAVCDDCPHVKLYPPLEVRKDPRCEPFLWKDVHAFASKLRCSKCGSRNLFLTLKIRDSWNA